MQYPVAQNKGADSIWTISGTWQAERIHACAGYQFLDL